MLSVRPDEIYNLAAQSHVHVSFDAAEYTGDVDALGVLRLLEAVHNAGLDRSCRIYRRSAGKTHLRRKSGCKGYRNRQYERLLRCEPEGIQTPGT